MPNSKSLFECYSLIFKDLATVKFKMVFIWHESYFINNQPKFIHYLNKCRLTLVMSIISFRINHSNPKQHVGQQILMSNLPV